MTTTPQPEFEGQTPQGSQGEPLASSQPGQTPPPPAYQPPAGNPGGPAAPGQMTAYGQQALAPEQQRQWGMFAHLVPLIAMVLSAGLLGFVGSLIIYVMYKDRGDFVRSHAANSLNVQIMTGIVLLVSFPLMLILVGFATYALALVFAFVLHVLGAIRANNGELWDPPLTPKFVK